MSTKPSHGITPQDVYAYFDGELSEDRADAVVAALEQDPDLAREHAQIAGLHASVVASLEAEADALPSARFEQIWDEVDRAIDRDARLQVEADRGASIWTRMWNAIAPARVPLFAAAASAAVVAIVVTQGGDDASDSANNSPAVASVEADETQPEPALSVAEPTPPKSNDPVEHLAQVDPTPPAPVEPEPEFAPMPVPETSDIEIHGLEFGGKHGSISNSGTVTVLYVDEDEETSSERSL